jgi:hypothetical protein
VGAVEAIVSRHQGELLRSLEDLEAELGDAHMSVAAAYEQIAFIRVGLRCLADAVAELQATLADQAGRDPSLRPPDERLGMRLSATETSCRSTMA